MKNWLKRILLLTVCGVLVFCLWSCAGNDKDEDNVTTKQVAGLEVVQSSIPVGVYAGSLDVTQIQATVYYSDATTEVINLSIDMIATNDRIKLKQAGQWLCKAIYKGATATFSISLLQPAEVKYFLKIVDGVPYAINGVLTGITDYEGEFYKQEYPIGTRITVKALGKESENFTYWTDNGQKIDGSVMAEVLMNKNHDYVAHYSPRVSTVSFELNGADQGAISPKTTNLLNESDIIKLSRLNDKSGIQYVFDGWTTDSSAVGEFAINFKGNRISFPYAVGLATTLYATWRPLGLTYTEYSGETGYVVSGYTLDYINSNTPVSDIPTELNIPTTYKGASVLGINLDAFISREASFLRKITIPQTVKFITAGAFRYCNQLKDIKVDANSRSFEDANGVLLKYGKEELIAYPSGKIAETYKVPNTINTIDAYAFYNALLGSISLADSVTTIGANSFNSVHIDHILFNDIDPYRISFPSDARLFNDNLAKVYVGTSYVHNYEQHIAFESVKAKLTTQMGDLAKVGIDNTGMILYRHIFNINSPFPSKTTEIIGVDRAYEGTMELPIRIDNYEVSSIGKNAFANCVYFTKLRVPSESKLERILEDAFLNTPWLTSVLADKTNNMSIILNSVIYKYLGSAEEYKLSSDIVKIAEGAFRNNKTIKYFNMKANNKLTDIGAYAFYNCSNLGGDLIFMSQLSNIYSYAFYNTKVETVSLTSASSMLTQIGNKAFANCLYLKEFTLGERTSQVANDAFINCISLERYSVSSASVHFKVYDGVLYSCSAGDGNPDTLFSYPAGKLSAVFDINRPTSNIVSLGIEHISSYAFYLSNIAGLIIPKSVIDINNDSFFIKGLIYVVFEDITTTVTYEAIFVKEDDEFGVFEPGYVVLQDSNDVVGFYNSHANEVAKNKTAVDTILGYVGDVSNPSMVYGYTNNPSDRENHNKLFIARASRTATTLEIPESLEIALDNRAVTYIGGFAFGGVYLKTLRLNSGITELRSFSLSEVDNLEQLFIPTGLFVPTITDKTFGRTFNNGLLIYIDYTALENYKTQWNVDSNKYFINSATGQAVAHFIYRLGEEGIGQIDPISDTITAETMPTPQRKGYVFSGWSDDKGNMIDFSKPYKIPYNINLVANWEPIVYTVNFEVESDANLAQKTISIKFGDAFVFNVPTADNRKFAYWKDSLGNTYGKSLEDETYDKWQTYLDGDSITLYAVWIINEYRIIYDEASLDIYGAAIDNTVIHVQFGQHFKLAVPILNGYVFLGWSLSPIVEGVNPKLLTDSNGNSLLLWSLSENESYTVYPYIIKKKDIKVNLYLDAETKYGEEKTISFHESFSFAYDPSKAPNESWLDTTKHCFIGWFDVNGKRYTDDEGIGLFNWDKSENTTLYAKWATVINTANVNLLTQMKDFSSCFVLSSDITVEKPIGSATNKFSGIFNGNGHTVTFNYTVDNSETFNNFDGYVGLFAYNQGTIKNLRLNANIVVNRNCPKLYVGSVAGRNEGKIVATYTQADQQEYTKTDITAKITVNLENTGVEAYIGGIVGYNGKAVVEKGNTAQAVIDNVSADVLLVTVNVNNAPYVPSKISSDKIFIGIYVGYVDNGKVVSNRSTTYKSKGEDDKLKTFGYVNTEEGAVVGINPIITM